MQRQNLHFERCRVTKLCGVLAGDVGRDCDLTRECPFIGPVERCLGGKRQHVGSLVFLSKSKVQRAHFCATRKQDVRSPGKPDGASSTQREMLERLRAQSCDLLFQNDQSGNLFTVALKRTGGPNAAALPRFSVRYCLVSGDEVLSCSGGLAGLSTTFGSTLFGSPSSNICCSATRTLCSS